MFEFNKGDIFEICDDGFDFIKEVSTGRYSKSIIKSSYFQNNYLKYLEIIDIRKHGRKNKYRVRLFLKNEKAENDTWNYLYHRSNLEDNPEELFKWISQSLLKIKINNNVLIKSSWAELAKKKLEELDE